MTAQIFNAELVALAKRSIQKRAFTDAAALTQGDPAAAMAGGMPGGMPGGMDPAMAGGMDPAMAGGMPMDPAMMGGMPPGMDPAMMGGMDPAMASMGAGVDTGGLEQRLATLESQLAAGGSTAGGAEQIKPKIDVNIEIMQIKHMLAKIIDAMGISIPASQMVATPEALTQMAQSSAPSGAEAAPQSSIGAIPPMGAAFPEKQGGVGYANGYAITKEATVPLDIRAAALKSLLKLKANNAR